VTSTAAAGGETALAKWRRRLSGEQQVGTLPDAPARWLPILRLGTTGVALVLLLLVIEGAGWTARLPYLLLTGALLLSVLALIVRERVRRSVSFAVLQLLLDLVLVTGLVYLTGGAYSFAALLYFGVVLAAALCVSQRVGILFASASSVALAAIQIAYHRGSLPDTPLPLPLVGDALLELHRLRVGRQAAYLIAQCLALHMVAGLGARLSWELTHIRILYGEILETMAEGVIVVDARRRLSFINPEALNLLGYKKREGLVGRAVDEVFRRREDHHLLDTLLGEKQSPVEVEIETRDGSRIFEIKPTRLYDQLKRFRGTIGILTDLSLRRRMADAERRAMRLEELATVSLGIAHEVRNPLASIRGCVQELGRKDDPLPPETHDRLVDIVCRESDRLDAIVSQFMRFAQVTVPTLEPLNLADLVREVVTLLENREDARDKTVTLEAPDETWIEADGERLKQVLLNLGINALEAMGPGEGRLELSVAEREVEVPRETRHAGARERSLELIGGVEVRVRDTGPGIDEESRDRVFLPFFTTKTKGTGLGLAIAERIVKLHQGTLRLEQHEEGGTVARIQLPVKG
jgi:two-component system sensor histidine kinase PilS (NtrC family)